MRVSVIGLGKLGAPLAAVLASKGIRVLGVDRDQARVQAVNSGHAPVDEPHLQDLIDRHRARLSATCDVEAAVAATDVTFVIVPTPSDAAGRFSNAAVLAAMETVGAGLRRKEGYHVVVITSTVMPGSTGGEISRTLELHSGRSVGPQLGLCYSPEFIALGSVVHDMLNPDMILIGENDEKSGDVIEQIYRHSCDSHPVIRRMNFINAELTKISVNTFLTTKISYANMLADVCDRLPGADVDVVTQAVGSDSRIGAKYLRGAIGYGGPCFPRDNAAFSALARSVGARAELADATDSLNLYQVERVLSAIATRLPPSGAVGVLGLAFKPDTPVIERSQSLPVIERLLELGREVVVYDPKALVPDFGAALRSIRAAPSAAACVRASSLAVVMTPWEEFRMIPAGAFAKPSRMAVIDCWRVIAPEVAVVADVIYLGRASTPASRIAHSGMAAEAAFASTLHVRPGAND